MWEWELNQVFQKVWVAKLRWVEAMVGCDRKLDMGHSQICTELDGKEKLLIPKFDNLQKHVGRMKCRYIAHLGLTMGQYFMSTNSQHAKNEQLWASKGQNTVVEIEASFGETNEKKCKFIQFVAMSFCF